MTIKLNIQESQIYGLIAPTTLDRPISSNEIRQILGYESSETRSIVHDLRMKLVPICACQNGYYMPQDKIEYIMYLRQLESRNNKQVNVHRMLATVDDVHDHMQEIEFDESYLKLANCIQMSLNI